MPGTALNNISFFQPVPQGFDHLDLEKAWNRVLEANDGLRLEIRSDPAPREMIPRSRDDFPVSQVVVPYLWTSIATHRHQDWDQARAWLLSEAERVFALKDSPLCWFQAFKVEGEDRWNYAVGIHHLIVDGWSAKLLRDKIAEALDQTSIEQKIPPYQTFVEREADYLNSAQRETDREYWLKELAVTPEPFELGRGREDGEPFFLRRTCDPTFAKACQKVAEKTGLSLFKQFMAALTVCVARMARVEHFAIGLANHNRNESDLHPVVGMFVSTLPLVRNYQAEQSFLELAKETSQKVNALLKEHSRYPYDLVVADQRKEHAADVNHLTLLNLVGHPDTSDDFEVVTLGRVAKGLAIHLNYEGKANRGHLDIGFAGDGKTVTVEDAEMLYEALVTVLEGAHRAPETPLSQLPLVNAAALDGLLGFNGGYVPYPDKETIPSLFALQVRRQPQKEALVCQGDSYTYSELDEWSDQIASELLVKNEGNALDGQFVGVCLGRGADLVAGVFGILKAGGAYVPLDPEYPTERLQFMITDAQIQKVLVHKRFALLLEGVSTLDPSRISKSGPALDPVHVEAEGLAYAIYTSGTTGKPKGVPIAHHQVAHLSQSLGKAFQVTQETRGLFFASLNFDASVAEIFLPLLVGGTLIVATEEHRSDGAALARLLMETEVSWATIPPALLAVMPRVELPHLTSLVVAGESTDPAVIDHWSKGRRMLNGYGPTENTVATSVGVFEAETSAGNIGPPIENVHCYVLDQGHLPVPVGVPGELYVAGVGVSSGYIRRPELTEERFLANPFFEESLRNPIMYKTGDLVRWLENGDLEFIGRVDFQVKIRGHRIECGEVGTAIGNLEGVKSCLVLPIPQGSTHRLVAYLLPEAEVELHIDALRQMTATQLPGYMVPSAFVVLKEFPRTPNGKVDRRALPVPEGGGERDKVAYVGPRNPLEETLCNLWSHVLGVEEVGVKDDFFDLGGDSLSCMKMVAGAEEAGFNFQVSDVREHSTIEGLAILLSSETQDEEAQSFPELVTAQGLEPFPMPRNALMMHRQEESMLAAGAAIEAMPARWEFLGPLNREALREALRYVIGRFDAFRLHIDEREDGVWLVPVTSDPTPEWEKADPADVASLLSAWSEETISATDPSCKFRLFDVGGDRHILCLRGTHELLDAWSSQAMLGALAEAYNAFRVGATPKSPAPTTLRTFTEWYHRLIDEGYLRKSQEFWAAKLADVGPVYPSPPRPCEKRNAYHCLTAMKPLPKALMTSFESLCGEHRGTLFEGCLTIYQLMLAQRSKDNRPLTAFVTALRDRKELQSVVGSLTNRMYLSTEVPEDRAFSATLHRVRESLNDARTHNHWPVWQEADPQGLGFPDLFFHYVARSDESGPDFQDVVVKPQPPSSPKSWPLGLALQVVDHREHPILLCLARAGFCDEAFLEEFMADYLACLNEVLQAADKRVGYANV